ncbi:uncharacterized protein LOC112033544 [Quercus suber]|uniref:uncharacterized protein LOC112033544 n=1 Tax=Quercus suber TaxID=58331 RepID=UPI000CE1D958|nr:uncharacterized protein LOC112033544 [Quercus suber]
MERQQLLHFCDSKHPLVYRPEYKGGATCLGCQESVVGPSYRCIRCWDNCHHKLCAEVPLGLHHPLHPLHPLILFDEKIGYLEKENSRCQVCNESRREYTYRCYRCDFNLHIKCAVLQLEAEFHDHQLTPFWKRITFTCDICGKEDKGWPYLCAICCFWIHKSCASFPRKLKVVRHKHPLHITHSSLELCESDSRFCLLCIQKVDTRYGLYYCSKCDFIAHLNCAIDRRNKEDINFLEFKDKENDDAELDQSFESTSAYIVKNFKREKDRTKIATEIQHFSHKHKLKLTEEEVHNNEKCDGCIRAISPPFYNCAECSFFLHKSCANLPMKKRHPLHQHPLTLQKSLFFCNACGQRTNGFVYICDPCWFKLDVQCSLVPELLTHEGHPHRLILSYTSFEQSCSSCGDRRNGVFRCTNCEFALDFKCVTLPRTTRYKQHEHPFTLSYAAEDESGEYYCDICEKERNPTHWFYYCAGCTYPAHPKCIHGKYPNLKFGGAYKFNCHQHPLTFIEETKDHPPCDECSDPCNELIYQCVPCNFHIHMNCV